MAATQTSTSFTVSWLGSDDAGGSGIASYDIYVSDDGGAYALWLNDSTATSAVYTGQNDHTYAFYSVAADNVGHVEAAPALPDATTLVQGQATTTTVVTTNLPAGSVYGQAVTFTATVTASGTDTATGTVQFVVDGANFNGPVTLSGGTAGIVVTTLHAGTYQIEAIYASDDPASFEDSQTGRALVADRHARAANHYRRQPDQGVRRGGAYIDAHL